MLARAEAKAQALGAALLRQGTSEGAELVEASMRRLSEADEVEQPGTLLKRWVGGWVLWRWLVGRWAGVRAGMRSRHVLTKGLHAQPRTAAVGLALNSLGRTLHSPLPSHALPSAQRAWPRRRLLRPGFQSHRGASGQRRRRQVCQALGSVHPGREDDAAG